MTIDEAIIHCEEVAIQKLKLKMKTMQSVLNVEKSMFNLQNGLKNLRTIKAGKMLFR